jgi:2-methylisocitrate lyase-like PEP mutase family enzyme
VTPPKCWPTPSNGGLADLDVGAINVFVPGLLDEPVAGLVESIGWKKVSVINVPGSLAPAKLQKVGVSRISDGPWTQRVALTAVADAIADLLAGGGLPEGTRVLS